MSLIYITGISGVGKSTIRDELINRGYDAYDTDEGDIANWSNKQTGIKADGPDARQDRTKEWLEQHEWIMSKERILELAGETSNRTVFLCGMASYQEDLRDLFSEVICLELDEENIKHRIVTRTTNNFGKSKDELEDILSWHKSFEEENRKKGALMIDAAKPVEEIVDEILKSLRV